MTTWVQSPREGRDRGPAGMARAWAGTLVAPRSFFSEGVAPGDQEPGLTFIVTVAVIYTIGTLAVSPLSILGEDGWFPILGDSIALSGFLVVLLTAVFIAPLGLHLVAAIQTVILMLTVDDRAGVSETVQVIAYATAPCALAWIPFSPIQLFVVGYAVVLLVIGLSTVHTISTRLAAVVGFLPATIVFGWAFGGTAAATATIELLGV
ncbi:YIP1 family protein [Natronocalculus amylovorans]|uniref:YIP1 family protein n=1 Tax=Natronocalculus amylovorans TaxID=2917812 RepID=A0AAE3K9D7_9EURY|nr:YIP1 family protein [Natronocalculus amylovorans]MCL9817948.1 YIP1 family protein [Natronocalculus amylovorans]